MQRKRLIQAYIALGSNMGDRENFLHQAIDDLQETPSIEVKKISAIYETDPVGYLDQPVFLNMVIRIETSLTAPLLFQAMCRIEQILGRTRDIRNGPRTIDLDLLIYGDEIYADPELTIPHPRMLERPFVLIPLLDVISTNKTASAAAITNQLQELEGKEGVKLWKKVQWLDE